MFDERYATFQAFGVSHFLAMILCFAAIALVFAFRKKIKLDRFQEIMIGAVMLGLEAVFLVWQISSWGLRKEHLPLQLCTISMYVNAIAMILGDKRVVKYTGYFSIAGAVIAIVVPMQGYAFPHYRYFHYYINHLLIVLTSIYMLAGAGEISYKKALISEAVFFGLVLFGIIPINIALQTDFMFLKNAGDYLQTVFLPSNLLTYAAAFAVHQAMFWTVETGNRMKRRKNK